MNYIIIPIFLALIILLFFINKTYKERFNDDGNEFVPLGYTRYGLRGERLNTFPIPDCHYDQYSCYTSTALPYFSPYDPTPRP